MGIEMAVKASTFRVNVIRILLLIMIRFSYTKSLNIVKTDGLNTEEVYGLCLLEKRILVYYLREFQNYLGKVCYFFYFLYVEISNHVLNCKFKKI